MSDKVTCVCLVGQVIVDVTLPQGNDLYKMRLGGIAHAARALWAINVPFVLAYICPSYLKGEVEKFAAEHKALGCRQIGVVDGSPNVIIIKEVKEAGDQGYEYLLRDEHACSFSESELRQLITEHGISDALIISGGFALPTVVSALSAVPRVYVDLTGAAKEWDSIATLGTPLEGLTLSTSSSTFRTRFESSGEKFQTQAIPAVAKCAILKENRGGSRFLNHGNTKSIETPAFLGATAHSVGVGDCFDAVWIALRQSRAEAECLRLASLIASEYAATTYPEEFQQNALAAMKIPAGELLEMRGVRLAWEARPNFPVYIAAPDFDFADQKPIDAIANALKYHNFTPRLPVRENGQMEKNATEARKMYLYSKDMAMLAQCKILVAVLTYNDPGTLIEIGIADTRGIPVIVFDPFNIAENAVLVSLPKLVTSDIERVVSAVYEQASLLAGSAS